MIKVKVKARQTLLDIAVKVYGTIEGAFVLAEQNNVGITDDLEVGMELSVPKFKNEDLSVKEYYIRKDLNAFTGLEGMSGIGYDDIPLNVY